MPSLAELQSDEKFAKLSPEAKNIVFEKLSAEDAAFAKLSPEAKGIVRSKLTGASVGAGIPQAKEPEPLAPVLVDQFKKGLASLGSLAGLAGDVARIPLNIGRTVMGQEADPLYYTKAIGGATEKMLGVKNLPVPTNEYGKPSKSNEYLAKIANFAGASVLPGIGVVGMAEKKLIAALVEGLGTTVSATSAVEGKEIGQQMAPTFGVSPETGGAIGELLGSLAGPGIAASAGKGVETLAGKAKTVIVDKTGLTGISKEAQEKAGKIAAVKQIDEALNANLSSNKNLAESVKLQEKVPGLKPTLGQASGAPGVQAIERTVATQNPQSLARAAEREIENTAAIENFANQKFPVTGASPTRPVKTIYQKVADGQKVALDRTERQIAQLAQSQQMMDNAAIGSKLRELRDVSQAQARAVKNAKYQDVYEAANKAGIKTGIDDVQAMIKEVSGSDANAAQIMPQLFGDLNAAIKKYKPEPSKILLADGKVAPSANIEIPFEALHSMQKRAAADMNAAIASGDNTRAYLIGKVNDLLKGKVAQFEGQQFGSVSEKLKDANAFFKDRYQPTFYEGLGGRIGPTARNKYGEITQDADIVRKLIFNPENRRGTSEFFDIYGSGAEAHSLLRNGVMDMFTKAVVRDGEVKPALVETFMRQHKAQLDLLPGIKNELSQIDKVNDQLLARRSAIEAQRKMFDKTVVAKIANTDNPSEVINKALTDPKTMRALVSQASKNRDDAHALAGAIANAVAKQKDPLNFLLQNEASLKSALAPLGKQHFENLVTLAKAEDVVGRMKAPTHVGLDKLQDVGEQAVGTSVKGLMSRLMNVQKGYMSGEYAIADVGGRYIYKWKAAETNKLLESAIYDPEMAKALLALKKDPTPAKMNNLRNHAYSHGIRIDAVASQQDRQ